ncbi:MAG: amino acid ABC transporter [Hyphomicrobiales bacterium]|nr:MAG: amino acid ABC transporter [Hyphomicrobiales bacterium]
MRITSRVSLVLSAAALALGIGAAQAQEKLRIGTEGAYPPFNNLTADGQLTGFDIDIARALCEEMKVECEFVTQDWDGIIPALQANRFDAIVASMSITEERQKQVDFTDPYYTNSLVFVAPKDSDLTPETADGKSIGVQEGTIAAAFATEHYPNADVKGYPSQLEAWADLSNGRLDAVLADFGVQYGWLQEDGKECCEFKGDAVSADDRIAIAIRKGDTALAEKLNAAIAAIRANGKYAEINAKYFPFDIFGE